MENNKINTSQNSSLFKLKSIFRTIIYWFKFQIYCIRHKHDASPWTIHHEFLDID